MAAVVHGVTLTSSTDGTSYTTGSFTPAAQDLLVLLVAKSDSVNDGSATDSKGGTWSFIKSGDFPSASGRVVAFVRNSLLTDASGLTVSYDCTGDAATGCVLFVARVSGMQKAGLAAVRQSNIGNDDLGLIPPQMFLDFAPLATNPLVAMVGNPNNPAAQDPPNTGGWLERADVGYATPQTGAEYISVDNGFVNSSFAWANQNGAWATIAVELDASVSLTTAVVTGGVW